MNPSTNCASLVLWSKTVSLSPAAGVPVNAPLIGSHFETFKTQVKYREFGAFGVAGTYSAVAPYLDYVEDGVTGLLVGNTVDSWVSALDRLIRAPELRAAIARLLAERALPRRRRPS